VGTTVLTGLLTRISILVKTQRDHMDLFNPNAVNSLLNEAFQTFDNNVNLKDFTPHFEWSKGEKEYALTVDLPGISKEKVDISVENNDLSISGERSSKADESRGEVLSSSISYGKFNLKFNLPQEADASLVEAKFLDGLLDIRIPISPRAQRQIVKIK